MADKNWKRTERIIAEMLGGRRVPVTGRQRGDVPDIEHESLSIEVKHRKSVPEWLLDAIEQAQAAKTGNKLPVVVLHKERSPHERDLVVIRLEDFRRFLSEVTETIEYGVNGNVGFPPIED